MEIEYPPSTSETRVVFKGAILADSGQIMKTALTELNADKPLIAIDLHGLEQLRLDLLQILLAFIRQQAERGIRPVVFYAARETEYLRRLGLQSNGLEEFFHAQ